MNYNVISHAFQNFEVFCKCTSFTSVYYTKLLVIGTTQYKLPTKLRGYIMPNTFSWSLQPIFGFSKFLCSWSYHLELPPLDIRNASNSISSFWSPTQNVLISTSWPLYQCPASPQHLRFGNTEPSIHSYTYLLLTSGFRQVLEYSFNYTPST